MSEAAQQKIVTIEGLATGNQLHPVQQALLDNGAFQCGYCTPGMVMGIVGLLQEHPKPTDDQVLSRMQRHICRCGNYPAILKSILQAAPQMAK